MDATNYLTQIFGQVIQSLLDGKATNDGSLVMTAMDVITGVAMIGMAVYLGYIIYATIIRVAASGEATGNSFNSYSLILRIVIAAALIFPWNGMSPVHRLTLKIVAEASEWTDGVWQNKLKPEISTSSNPVTSVPINTIHTTGNALRILTCSTYLHNWSGEYIIKAVAGGYDFGDGKCGEIRWPLALKRLPAASFNEAQNAVSSLFHDLVPLAHEIYQQQYTTLGQAHAVGLHYTEAFIGDKAQQLQVIAQRYSSRLNGALVASNLAKTDLGDSWLTAGSHWSTISAARSKAYADVNAVQQSISLVQTTDGNPLAGWDDMDRVELNASTLNKINRALKAIITQAAQADTQDKINTPKRIEFTPSIACSDFDCSIEKLEKHTSEWLQGAILGRLANSGDDPYSALIDTGNLMTSTARDLYLWQGVAAPVRTVPVVGYVAEEAQKMMSQFAALLQRGGVMLAIWLPNSASVVWSLMIISWTIAIMLALIAGPIGLIALIMPHDNNSVFPPIAKSAFMLTLAAAVMPIIGLVGLAASTIVVTAIIKAVNIVFWATNIVDSTSGVINTVGMITLYIYVIIGAVVITFMGLIIGLYKGIAAIFGASDSSGVGEHHVNSVGSAGGGAAGAGAGTSAMSMGKMGRGGKGNSIKGK